MVCLVAVGAVCAAGCKTGSKPPSVGEAWQASQTNAAQLATASPDAAGAAGPATVPKPTSPEDVIAAVDGFPIARSGVVDLLMEGHGVGILEQLIVLEQAERLAAKKGLSISQADVEAEYDRALVKLLGDNAPDDPQALRRQAAETILEEMLATRNISRREFMIVTRRNAILRKILGADLHFDEEQLKEEFARLYGEKVEIRHIQLASRADVDRVLEQRKTGVEFGELAQRYSANRGSGQKQGLLPPFSANDPDVPELLRQTAFGMEIGQESIPLRANDWFHLIRLERRIPARTVGFESVRGEVERSLRGRRTEPGMQEMYAKLFNEAQIEILDPTLRREFFKKHPEHPSTKKAR